MKKGNGKPSVPQRDAQVLWLTGGKGNKVMKKERKAKLLFHGKLKAGFTIEAAVIVPLALLLTASLMTVMFLLHDRVLFSTVSIYELMEHADSYQKDLTAAEEEVTQVLGKRLVTVRAPEVSGEETADGMQIDSRGEAEIPMYFVRDLLGDGSGELRTRVNISNLNGRKALIRYKTIVDGAGFLAGGGEEGGKEDEEG